MARAPRTPRVRQQRPVAEDLPNMTGEGVAQVKIKAADSAIKAFVAAKDEFNVAKETLDETQKTVLKVMADNDLTIYTYNDLKVSISTGKTKVNVKHVKKQSAEREDP